MKTRTYIILFLTAFLFVTGCEKKPEKKVKQITKQEKKMPSPSPAEISTDNTIAKTDDVKKGPFDFIKMDNPAYKKHKKGIIVLSHRKHSDDYKISCGECHHDEKGIPLNNINLNDKVQGCIECHQKPGERPKGKGAPKLSKKERLEYHAEAIHYNCKDCHKKHNKKTGTKKAPTSCNKCHKKK
ncbi:cytochrome c3 family protein [Desulfobacterales bacterium HSG16]|nr:cytochrome c3 family protein [Desulfobacterales bacterium HSG16]